MAHLEKKDMKQTIRSSLVGFAVGDVSKSKFLRTHTGH